MNPYVRPLGERWWHGDARQDDRRQHPQGRRWHRAHPPSGQADEAGLARAAANEQYIDILELIWLSRSEHLRLFRRGQQAPLRGTLLRLDDHRHVLYT